MNGWSNYETWEAFNMITSYEETYLKASEMVDLRAVLIEALEIAGADKDHLDVSKVDFKELKEAL
jgi:hypothetical protein